MLFVSLRCRSYSRVYIHTGTNLLGVYANQWVGVVSKWKIPYQRPF
jgi:hypothetical protein